MTFSASFLVRISLTALMLMTCSMASGQSMQSEQYKGEGILVFRERDSQSDEFAPAIKFRSYEKFATVFHFDVGTGNPMILPPYLVAAVIRIDEFQTDELLTEADQSKLEAYERKLKDWVKRFPRAGSLIKPRLAEVGEDLKKFKSGWVLHNKQWETRAAYEATLEAARRKDAADREAREKMEVAAQRSEYERSERARAAEAVLNQLIANRRNCKPVTFGGQHLMADFNDFANLAAKDINRAKAQSRMRLPESITQGAVDLPGLGDVASGATVASCGLREGVSSGAPAVLFMYDDKGCTMFRLALALKTEGDRTVNTGDLQAAARMLSTTLPAIAEWLPLALVSAHTKLEFQRNAQGNAEKAWVPKYGGWTKVSGHFCSLKVNAPIVQADGSFYSMVVVSVF